MHRQLSTHEFKRLAFSKYMFETGIIQSRLPEPLFNIAVLTLHDSVEFFMQLACEYLDYGSSKPDFMEYWELISKKLAPEGLSGKESMRRLNKVRVQLKHHGIFPSKVELEALADAVHTFFNSNTPIIFGLHFSDVTLLDFLQFETSRERLKTAIHQFRNGNINGAATHLRASFYYLISDFENHVRWQKYKSPFFFGRSMTFENAFFMGIEDRRFGRFVDKTQESIMQIQQAIKILSLGIDYRKYVAFEELTPHLALSTDGTEHFSFSNKWPDLTSEEFEYCVSFVLESAFELQEALTGIHIPLKRIHSTNNFPDPDNLAD